MTFTEAIERGAKGVHIRRASWAPGMYVRLKRGAAVPQLVFPDGTKGMWVYGQEEKDAEDWEVKK